MLGTALAQLRHGLSLVFGSRVRIADFERIVADILATRAEFGGIGDLAAFRGRALTEDARRPVDERRLRRLVRAAYDNTAFYRHHLDRAGLRPDDLELSTLDTLPVTPKEALRALPEAFVDRRVRPWYRAETTGTTGEPTAVWFSRYEADLFSAMTAVSLLIDFDLGADDVVQLNLSSRAMFGIHCVLNATALIGATANSVGLVAPEVALARLTGSAHLAGRAPRPTLLSTYPSYLGLLVSTGERLGHDASDFGLRTIMCGGEILTDGLRRRAERLFGATVAETYGMTEISPAGAQLCAGGHLHFNQEQGFTEVLDPTGTRPAAPGELGVLTFTPVHPYRETTLLLRLFSGDVVRPLAGDDLDCALAGSRATTRVLGKVAHLREVDGRVVTPREILELVEADPAAVLPTRFATEVTADGLVLHLLCREDGVAGRTHERGVALGLPLAGVVAHTELATMPATMPVRADLRELRFADTVAANRTEFAR